MNTEPHIFSLIKSLNMSEKRYFKVYSQKHILGSQNKYSILFDTIDKSDLYDEKEIEKSLKKYKYSSKFLSSDKKYLYSLILKSLNEFHSSKTNNLKIKENLGSIEILFYKGLYEECLKIISKTKKLIEKSESYTLMLDLLNWEKKCSGYSMGLKKASEVNNKISMYIDIVNNNKLITDLYYKSYELRNLYEKNRSPEAIEQFEKILANDILKDIKNAYSLNAKVFYLLIYSHYYYVIDDNQLEMDYLQKLINLLNASETYQMENPLDYVSIYDRLLNLKKNLESKSFFKDIRILREFSGKVKIQKEVVQERIFFHTYFSELEHLIIFNKIDEALKVINKVEYKINHEKFKIEPYYIIGINYLFASILCISGEYSKGLKYVNKILNNYKFDDRPQAYIRSEFLNIIIHYELKNYELVLSIIKSFDRKYKNKDGFNKVEKQIIKTLLKVSENPILHKEIKEFVKLNNLLEDKNNESNTLTSVLNMNYKRYIESKINRINTK